MDERVQQILQRCLTMHQSELMAAIERCESPVEQMLGMVLHQLRYAYLDTHKFVMMPQSRIGKYRVDFLLSYITRGKTKQVVVECDGHEFHERTKEQAQHDKERDRFLQSQGYQVLRYTGSEIWKNPHHCASEVINILLFDREAGEKHEPQAVHQH